MAPVRAEGLLALETSLAEVMWTKEENRDPEQALQPDDTGRTQGDGSENQLGHWLLKLQAYSGDSQFLVSQPSYFEAAGRHPCRSRT